MAEQDQERSEAATPHKLREAQRRGQTAKSQELVFVAILAALVATLFATGPVLAARMLALARALLLEAGRGDWSAPGILAWLGDAVWQVLAMLAPLLAALATAAVVASFLQVGPVFSAKPITPDWERLNPAAGLKRLFSLRLVYEAFKGSVKLALAAATLWLALRSLLPTLFGLIQVPPRAHGLVLMSQLAPMLSKLLLALALVATVDVGYTRWDFARKMRMSRREITDEHKQREGDPRIRSRLRQLRLEMLKQSRAVRQVPGADVLLTNPTHLAIALSYKHGEMPAPKMLAKGAGEAAQRMRQMAQRHGIPIVENRPLARALYRRLQSDQFIPEDLYPQVARILLWVYAMRTARQRS